MVELTTGRLFCCFARVKPTSDPLNPEKLNSKNHKKSI